MKAEKLNRRSLLKRLIVFMAGIFIFKKIPCSDAMFQATKESPKVLRVFHSNATNWNFQNSQARGRHYWEHVDINACRKMIEKGLRTLSGKDNLVDAWEWVFHQNNGSGYKKDQKIAIKLNWNDCDPSLGDGPDGNYLVSNMQIVQALVENMLSHIHGLRAEKLLIGDPSRTPYKRIRSVLSELGVQIVEYGSNIFTNSHAAHIDYPNWRIDYVCNSMFGRSDHLIDMPLLKAITPSWGISGALKDAQGKVGLANASYRNNRKAWIKKHGRTFSKTNKLNTLVHMNSHPWIKGKRRLIIADGLYGLYNGQHFPSGPKDDIPRPWLLFGNASPNSILLSNDPVAIDCVMHDLVRFERMQHGLNGSFLKSVKFKKPIQIACAAAGLGSNDDPIESKVNPSPTGPVFSYPVIDYKVVVAKRINRNQ